VGYRYLRLDMYFKNTATLKKKKYQRNLQSVPLLLPDCYYQQYAQINDNPIV